MMDDNTLVIYSISREEVEGKVYSGVLKVIKALDHVTNSGYQNLVMSFSGYDDTSEEIYEILEIREWVKGLVSRVPHLLYYLLDKYENRQNFMMTYCDVRTYYEGEKLNEFEWNARGIEVEDRPKISIYLEVKDYQYDHLLKGLKKLRTRSNVSKEGLDETIEWLNELTDYQFLQGS